MATPAFPYRTSFWCEQAPTRLPALDGDQQVDIAVVGGGFAGLSSARYLKEADPSLTVALVEGEYVGFGASGRNAGGVSLLPPMGWLMHNLGNPGRSEPVRWAANYIRSQVQEWITWLGQEQIDCDLRPDPLLIAAQSHFQEGVLKWLTGQLSALGRPFEWLPKQEAMQQIGYPVHSAICYEGYVVQPYKLARGILQALLRRGIQVYEGTRVAEVKPTASGVDVLTETGARLRARKVVLATNAYTQHLKLGQKVSGVVPLHTYMIATEPLDRSTIERLRFEQQFLADASLSFHYGRLYGDRLLFGGTDRRSGVTPADDQHDDSFRKLQNTLYKRFPYLADKQLGVAWGGPFQQTLSDNPMVKPLPDNPDVLLNIGYGGSGVVLTQFSGKMITGLALGAKYLDPDAERLRQLYESMRLNLGHLAQTGVHILRHMVGV